MYVSTKGWFSVCRCLTLLIQVLYPCRSDEDGIARDQRYGADRPPQYGATLAHASALSTEKYRPDRIIIECS